MDIRQRIATIRTMETRFTRVKKAVEALHRDLDRYEKLLGSVGELERYQESGLWKEDFEADERGELPDGLRRGVLSEDGLYDLLEDISELNARMTLSRK
jgi:hypothetical protein